MCGLYLLHLTSSVIVCRHATAFLPDLHCSSLQEAIPNRPFGHIASAITSDLHLDTSSTFSHQYIFCMLVLSDWA